MKNMIRVPGIIAFIIIFAALAAGIYYFSGSLIKAGIEKAGTSAVGAKVEVGSVNLKLSPPTISVSKVAVLMLTNPCKIYLSLTKLLLA